jgi:cyclopropane fatty-acyl-phospholipid synthase-like methyltransferase
MRGRRRALVIGDGDGRFTARLLAENSGVHVDAVDASLAMLRALTRSAKSHALRVRPICADARAWRPRQDSRPPRYDLVVTHFFLDCLATDEVRALAERLRDAVEPRGIWVVSEFAVPRGLFGLLVASQLVRALYWAFGLLTGLEQRTLPDYDAALREAGFILARQRSWLGGLLVSQLWIVA